MVLVTLKGLLAKVIQGLTGASLFSQQKPGVSERFNVESIEPWGTLLVLRDGLSSPYLVSPFAIGASPKLPDASSESTTLQYVLSTSIQPQDPSISRAFLESQLSIFNQTDDVWRHEFLEGLILAYHGARRAVLEEDAIVWLRMHSVKHLYLTSDVEIPTITNMTLSYITATPPPGPCVIKYPRNNPEASMVFDVYRLFEDSYDSFLFGAIPKASPPGGWVLTNITRPSSFDPDIHVHYVPVASRIPSLSSALPLAGKRFGLKDIFDAQGLPTSAGSIAYSTVHSISNQTAPSIQSLINLGASMVGKTRTSQFAHGAQPWEFVDVPYSWNPRGDGFLTAAASSSGSACALVGHEWLDFTVGSDTRGSIRKPAALVGSYGIRPSHGSLDLTGVVPLSEEMDTAGFFARDPLLFCDVARLWYTESLAAEQKRSDFPSKILYPIDHFPVKNPKAQAVYDRFFQALHDHLNITKVPINFTETLAPHLPNGNFTAFQLSSNKLAEYRSWNSVGQPIVEAYQSLFSRAPVFDPVPTRAFARAKSITPEEFEQAVKLKRTFRDAMAEHVFKVNTLSCADSIFVYDAATGGLPSYRVEDFNSLFGSAPFLLTAPGVDHEVVAADFFHFIASMAELPEITVPIGQIRYFSQLSRIWEDLPITVQLVSRKGCDGMLLDLVEKMAIEHIISSVQIGPSAF